VDNKKLIYGLDTHMEKEKVSNIGFLLKAPFAGYKPEINYIEKEQL